MSQVPTAPAPRIAATGHLCLDLVPGLNGIVPTAGSLVEVGPFKTRIGGSVANTGGALAALGASVSLSAAIGDDVFGDLAERMLNELGAAEVTVRRIPDLATSYSIVLDLPNRDRSFLHHVGANEAFDGREIDLQEIDLLHIGYPQILPGLLAEDGIRLTELLEKARSSGVTTSVDFATVDPEISKQHSWSTLLETWAPLIDVLTPSIDDLSAGLEIPGTRPEDVSAAADRLLDLGAAVVAVTAGDAGMVLRTAEGARLKAGGRVLTGLSEAWANRQIWTPPADGTVVRTTAAGDTATAGLLYGLASGASPEATLRLAAGVAALHCSGVDRLPPITDPTYDRVTLRKMSIDGWSTDGLGMLHGPAESRKDLDLPAIRSRTAKMLAEADIALAPEEVENIEIAHFGLSRHDTTGLQLVVYVNTERCCAKEMVLFPGQTCPEHLHPPFEDTPGKEETLRVRKGTVYLYVPGDPTPDPMGAPYRAEHYTVWHQIKMEPGDQYTIPPMTKHWFHAPEGAIISEFSTQSRDEYDVFTDPAIVRIPDDDSRRLD